MKLEFDSTTVKRIITHQQKYTLLSAAAVSSLTIGFLHARSCRIKKIAAFPVWKYKWKNYIMGDALMTLHRTPGTQSTCLSHTDSSAPENVLSEGLTSSWRPRFCLFVSLGALEVAEGKETALSSKAQGCSCHWYGGKATREISTNSEISARASSRLGRALLAMAS